MNWEVVLFPLAILHLEPACSCIIVVSRECWCGPVLHRFSNTFSLAKSLMLRERMCLDFIEDRSHHSSRYCLPSSLYSSSQEERLRGKECLYVRISCLATAQELPAGGRS